VVCASVAAVSAIGLGIAYNRARSSGVIRTDVEQPVSTASQLTTSPLLLTRAAQPVVRKITPRAADESAHSQSRSVPDRSSVAWLPKVVPKPRCSSMAGHCICAHRGQRPVCSIGIRSR